MILKKKHFHLKLHKFIINYPFCLVSTVICILHVFTVKALRIIEPPHLSLLVNASKFSHDDILILVSVSTKHNRSFAIEKSILCSQIINKTWVFS